MRLLTTALLASSLAALLAIHLSNGSANVAELLQFSDGHPTLSAQLLDQGEPPQHRGSGRRAVI